MLHMEGETSSRVQNWLRAHRDAFDVHAPNDAELFRSEWSSDSWTIETPSRTSSSAGEGDSQGTEIKGFHVRSNTTMKKAPPSPWGSWRLLRFTQANLSEYVKEEMNHLDITNLEQGWYMGALSEAIIRKVEAEEQLLQHCQEQEELTGKELEKGFRPSVIVK